MIAIQIQDYCRETDKFWIIERDGKSLIRISKDEPHNTYFDSWEDAWEALKRRAWQDIVDKRAAVTHAQHNADEIEKMTKPNYRPVGFR
jgi:hypothetical protein